MEYKMNKKSIILISSFLFSFFYTYSQSSNYIIEKGDKIDIMVMEHPEFSISEIIVLPDGFIQYPGLGSIKAAGMSSQVLTDSLQKSLEKYVVNPMVSIFIRKIQNQMLNVFGHVNKPGQYQLYDKVSIFTAISMAGGFKSLKNVKSILIIRANKTTEEIKIKDYLSVAICDKEVPMVNAGDILYVKEPKETNWSKVSFFFTLIFGLTTLAKLFL